MKYGRIVGSLGVLLLACQGDRAGGLDPDPARVVAIRLQPDSVELAPLDPKANRVERRQHDAVRLKADGHYPGRIGLEPAGTIALAGEQQDSQ